MSEWKTWFQEPMKNELCIIAISPNVIMIGIYNGEGLFTDSNGKPKARIGEISYWASITNPWKEDKE